MGKSKDYVRGDMRTGDGLKHRKLKEDKRWKFDRRKVPNETSDDDDEEEYSNWHADEEDHQW